MDPFDPTSRQVSILNDKADKATAEVRKILKEEFTPNDRVALYKACARGELSTMDPKVQRLVGLLAVLALHTMAQDR